MAAPFIDLSRYPLVTVTFEGLATDQEFEQYLDGMTREILNRKQKTVSILDARNSGRTPPIQRKRQAEWLKENESALREYSLGTAFVITSALVRGALTAILWLQPMAAPHTIVATLAEAERWAEARLRAAGLTIPAPAPSTASRP